MSRFYLPRTARKAGVAACAVLVSSLACDTGTAASFTRDGDRCEVRATRNQDAFEVRLTLLCESDGTDCFVIESLSCDGTAKPDDVPIDLTSAADACPGEDWCVADCDAGLEEPGRIWDTPSLREVDGCNVYEDANG